MIPKLLDRPIAFHRCFVDIGCGITGALMLSQAVYWSKRTRDGDGWFYKTQAEWMEETGLSRTEQEKARRTLRALGVIDEVRKGVPAKLYYRVNDERLTMALSGLINDVTLDDVFLVFKTTLNGLSKTGYMRAIKAGVKSEYVDYAQVLQRDGMVCGICEGVINRGPGVGLESLAFDYKKPACEGGAHEAGNIQPTHQFCCNEKADKSAYPKQSRMSSLDKQAGLGEASQSAYPKQTITETTHNTTTETTDIGAQQKKTGRKKRVGESPRRNNKTHLPDSFKPSPDHYSLSEELGINLDFELPQFRDHHAAKGSTMKDWNAALRTWIRNAAKFNRGKNNKSNAGYLQQPSDNTNYREGVNEDGSF